MPATFDDFGVSFLYPDNWSVTEHDGADQPQTVGLESPNGAQWTLHVWEGPVDLQAQLREAVDAMRSVYEELEEHEQPTPDDGADHGWDLDFFCLDMLVTAKVRGALLPGRALLWIYQAESREMDELTPVFKAMTASLLGKARA